ncbi:AhpC/TSA family protein [Mucilaginibacter sp. HC2]|uniref:TlpA disulfide reductase family protein n=1 Tax=Mucilaginibacter inviolabilis TaxID=2714892 RepID=UPI00140C59F7|nr:TlpA disulfide reductase family protein [Mucilaginibacter inviolabilis]NHA03403.1 AhpC/TSA family protein [Mucilaginibacter inviolabilis]
MNFNKHTMLFILSIWGGAIIPFSAHAQQKNYTIKGMVADLQAPAKVYIGYTTDDKVGLTDSAIVENGRFEFKQYTLHPVNALLYVSRTGKPTNRISNNKDITNVYIEPNASIILTSDHSLAERKISGSKTEQDYEGYLKYVHSYDQQLDTLRWKIATTAKDTSKPAETVKMQLLERFRLVTEDKRKKTKEYVLTHPAQQLSLNLLEEYSGQFIDYKDIKPAFDGLEPGLRNSPQGKIFSKQIEEANSLAVGTMAPEFSQTDSLGKIISLSSFRGKYILVDFWASWCGPCRVENVVIKEAYSEFKDKNFEILAVSLDFNRANWLKAIKDDGLPWYHVCDLKYWKNAVALQYKIVSVPQNVLVDPSGKIIARNLKGDALKEKLAELLR